MNGNLLGYFLRLAFRNLQASRWMTVLIAVTLGIGIGASMLSLSLLHVLSADPIPSKSERLFQVTPFAKHGRIAPAAAFTYRDAVSLSSDTQARLVILAAGLSTFRSTQTDTAPPRQVRVRYTTRHFFDLFDAPFLAGSTWGDREDADGAPVAVLSNELAQEGFADAGAIGSSFRLGGVTFRVIGVLAPWRPAPRYYDLSIGAYAPADDVYIPLNAIKNLNDSAFASFSCPPGAILPGSATAARLPTSNCVWLTAWTQLDDEHKQQSFRRFLDNYLAAQQHDG
ncbi:MAG: ABC transporter permease, partial [Xanthomonadaceae bacterium]|nr:ABC transporter permease [Xanthomonadaceae bacterium]